MKFSKPNIDASLAASRNSDPTEKKVNPRVHEAMQQYEILKKQLYAHFF